MRPMYKILTISIASLAAVGAQAAPGNNPASVQYVQQYVNNAIANNPGLRGATGATGATGGTGGTGTTYAVGDYYPNNATSSTALGVVYYIYPNSQGAHGIIVDMTDAIAPPAPNSGVSSAPWTASNQVNNTIFNGFGFGSGGPNTIQIGATVAATNGYAATAAGACLQRNIIINSTAYGDWALPSSSELQQLVTWNNTVTTLSGYTKMSGLYWSSTQATSSPTGNPAGYAVYYNTTSPSSQQSISKLTTTLGTRCIRYF